ncbi:hypothetical protein HK102_013864 [Quaeritorhiza haematococci]|nr:hypothetical protein HK102_013864 [Quaeritorhiza haematococci]
MAHRQNVVEVIGLALPNAGSNLYQMLVLLRLLTHRTTLSVSRGKTRPLAEFFLNYVTSNAPNPITPPNPSNHASTTTTIASGRHGAKDDFVQALMVLSNLCTADAGFREVVKSAPNISRLYKGLIKMLGDTNFMLVVSSLRILVRLVADEPIGQKLFNDTNLGETWTLILAIISQNGRGGPNGSKDGAKSESDRDIESGKVDNGGAGGEDNDDQDLLRTAVVDLLEDMLANERLKEAIKRSPTAWSSLESTITSDTTRCMQISPFLSQLLHHNIFTPQICTITMNSNIIPQTIESLKQTSTWLSAALPSLGTIGNGMGKMCSPSRVESLKNACGFVGAVGRAVGDVCVGVERGAGGEEEGHAQEEFDDDETADGLSQYFPAPHTHPLSHRVCQEHLFNSIPVLMECIKILLRRIIQGYRNTVNPVMHNDRMGTSRIGNVEGEEEGPGDGLVELEWRMRSGEDVMHAYNEDGVQRDEDGEGEGSSARSMVLLCEGVDDDGNLRTRFALARVEVSSLSGFIELFRCVKQQNEKPWAYDDKGEDNHHEGGVWEESEGNCAIVDMRVQEVALVGMGLVEKVLTLRGERFPYKVLNEHVEVIAARALQGATDPYVIQTAFHIAMALEDARGDHEAGGGSGEADMGGGKFGRIVTEISKMNLERQERWMRVCAGSRRHARLDVGATRNHKKVSWDQMDTDADQEELSMAHSLDGDSFDEYEGLYPQQQHHRQRGKGSRSFLDDRDPDQALDSLRAFEKELNDMALRMQREIKLRDSIHSNKVLAYESKVSLLQTEIKHLKEMLEAKASIAKNAEMTISESGRKIGELQVKVAQSERENIWLRDESDKLRNSMMDLKAKKAGDDERIADLEKKLDHTTRNVESLTEELEHRNAQTADVRSELEKFKLQREEKEGKLEARIREYMALEEQAAEECAQLKRDNAELERRILELENELSEQEHEHEEMVSRLAQSLGNIRKKKPRGGGGGGGSGDHRGATAGNFETLSKSERGRHGGVTGATGRGDSNAVADPGNPPSEARRPGTGRRTLSRAVKNSSKAVENFVADSVGDENDFDVLEKKLKQASIR